MAQTGGRIHSSDASRIGNVTGIKPEDWQGEPNLTPPCTSGDSSCNTSRSEKLKDLELPEFTRTTYRRYD
jgi:hypothetical protein